MGLPNVASTRNGETAAEPGSNPSATRGMLARIPRIDVATAVLLAALGVVVVLLGQQILEPWLRAMDEDIYFQADPLRVIEQMNTRWHKGGYTRNHPLFVSLVMPPVLVFRKLTGLSHLDAALAAMVACAALWMPAMYATLRLAGCRVVDAALFTAASLTTASFLFFSPVPDTFPFSAITMLVPFMALAVIHQVRRQERLLTVAGLVSLSLNVANWMAGIAAAFAALRWRRALQVCANVLAIGTLLWGVQRRAFQDLEFFLDKPPDPESVYAPSLERVVMATKGVLLHTAVVPRVELCDRAPVKWAPDAPKYFVSVQEATIKEPIAVVAALSWVALLILGAFGLRETSPPFRVALGATILGQLALHTVFGGEIFLYSLHYVALLVMVAAMATRGPYRRIALALVCVFAVTAATNNVHQLRRTATYFANPPGELTREGHACKY